MSLSHILLISCILKITEQRKNLVKYVTCVESGKNLHDIIISHYKNSIALLDNCYIRFCSKLYRQIVGIPISTNCAPLAADLILLCYEKDIYLLFHAVSFS